MAALFCATLPGAVLQASGEKNDIMLALWLVSGAYFLLQRQPVYAGLAVGLTLATKGTAYVFAPALLIVIALIERRRLRWITLSVSLTGAVVLLNAPHYTRNIAFSGSPLGYNSPFGDGTFLYANEHFGWKSTASNVLRHLSDQLGGRNPNWNQGVYNGVVRVHRLLGINPQDPGSTWQWSRYAPPENTRHEANANNRWHLLLLCGAFSFAAWRALRHREHAWLFYGMGLAVAFLGFCFYLRWQPYSARLLVPLFILGAPTAGFLLERIRPQVLAFAVCLFLVDTARLPLLENWIRPLRGPNNLFVTPRESRYFADTGSTQTRQSYLRSVDLVTRSGCQDVGIDISAYPLEYPFQALLLARNPHVRFQHVNVRNASVRYRRHDTPQPCAVVPLHNGSA
jgi:4-amino-4-deoxy-L-arabinose transferase-like glycosyltransferase